MRAIHQWVAGAVLVSAALPAAMSVGPASATARPARNQPTDTISTVAGGVGGPGPARQVAISVCGISNPCPLTFAGGRLYFGDQNHAVRRISLHGGWLTTPVGNGLNNMPADAPTSSGEPATAAGMAEPGGTSVDAAGDLAYTDILRSLVRLVPASGGTFFGQAMTAGHVYTIAGDGIRGFTGDGGPAVTAELRRPVDASMDAAGNIVIACDGESTRAPAQAARVRVVAAVTGTFYGQNMIAGDIYTIAGADTGTTVSGDGGPATAAGLGITIGSVRPDQDGNLIIADLSANQVRVVAAATGTFYGQNMTAGDIYTVAGNGTPGFSGDGGPATAAALDVPAGVAPDSAGNLVIADTGNNRIRVLAATTGTFYRLAMTAGHIYTVAGGGTSTAVGAPALRASLRHPTGIAVDSTGNLVFAESFGYRIRVVAGATGRSYGAAMTAGDVYPIAGTGSRRISADGLAATRTALDQPNGVASDSAGDVFIADTVNRRVVMVAARSGRLFGRRMTAGDMYTLASLGGLWATEMVTDHAGNLLVINPHVGSSTIDVVAATSGRFYGQAMTAGHRYIIAGGGTTPPANGVPALKAQILFGFAGQLAVTADGSVIIAASFQNLILMMPVTAGTFFGQKMAAEHIYVIAGNGSFEWNGGDGGPATKEGMTPWGVAVDNAGNVLISDVVDERIWVVPPVSGTFYGLAMTAAHIYTIIGDGAPVAGSGIDAINLTVDKFGNVLMTDRTVQIAVFTPGTYYGQSMQAGNVYTIAGGGAGGGPDALGDGGPALNAIVSSTMTGIVVGPTGDVLFADVGFSRIRQITG